MFYYIRNAITYQIFIISPRYRPSPPIIAGRRPEQLHLIRPERAAFFLMQDTPYILRPFSPARSSCTARFAGSFPLQHRSSPALSPPPNSASISLSLHYIFHLIAGSSFYNAAIRFDDFYDTSRRSPFRLRHYQSSGHACSHWPTAFI